MRGRSHKTHILHILYGKAIITWFICFISGLLTVIENIYEKITHKQIKIRSEYFREKNSRKTGRPKRCGQRKMNSDHIVVDL